MTALTLTETLSREITSCLGTSSTIVRRSTRTIFWITGQTMMRPGPLTPSKRPRKKMTPRSYSRRTLIELVSSMKTSTTTALQKIGSSVIASLLFLVGRDEQRQPLDAIHVQLLPARHRAARNGVPGLAVNTDGSATREVRERFGAIADQLLGAGDDAPSPGTHREPDGAEHREARYGRDGADEAAVQRRPRLARVHQDDRPDDEGGKAPETERAEARREELGDHHADAEHDECESRKVDGKDLQRVKA